MAINFPSNPTNAQEVTEGNVTYVYNATKGYWESSEVSSGASSGASIDVLADMAALIAKTGMSNGDQAFVTGNNNLYIYSGTGWYKIATVQNDSPSAITGVNGTYSLAIDGTATTITAVSTDPEGFPLTWSYSTSGLGSIATVSQSDNVFTITPSTDDTDFGTFTLTINATDGVNGAVSTNTSIILQFYIQNSQYTSTLVEATGTGTNLTFVDASTQNHTITNTDVVAGTFSPYRSGGYSTYFDGSGDSIYINDTQSLGNGDWTIEFWVNASSLADQYKILVDYRPGTSQGLYPTILLNYGVIGLYYSTGMRITGTTNLSVDTWHHVAISKSGSSTKMFLDGTQEGSTLSDANTYIGNTVYVGGNGFGAQFSLLGYISDLRIVKGTAVYTSNFTPSTKPLTAITNTTLLTCHLPYIADGSTNAHSITVTGNVSTKPLTPFNNLEYSEALHGSSGYFDGTGDYLVLPEVASTSGDVTIEFWINPSKIQTYNGDAFIIGNNINGLGTWAISLYAPTNKIGVWLDSFSSLRTLSNETVNRESWNHIALVKNAGIIRLYINGIQESATITQSANFGQGSNVYIGQYHAGGQPYTGYVSDVRVVNGTAIYTSNFTPPTAPLTAVTNTTFLLNPNPSIIDKAQTSNLKLIGGPTGSTTQAKFANTKSIDFGDVSQTYVMEVSSGAGYTGEFTIEFWMYNTNVTSTWQSLISNSYVSGSEYFRLYKNDGSGAFALYHNSTSAKLTGIGTIANNTWTHVAIVRDSSNDITVYQDGISIGSYNNNQIFGTASSPVNIGKGGVGDGSSYPMSGYIQDLRITKVLARYTSNFTPPTALLKG